MKEEKYLELLKNEKYEELKIKLEEEIRISGAIKLNSKSRISAISELQKYNNKNLRHTLLGHGKIDNQYVFTDSYSLYRLNDNLGYDFNERFPDVTKILDNTTSTMQESDITIDELSYCVKTKTHYINQNIFENKVPFDYKRLKTLIGVMGISCKIYVAKDMIVFINDNNELGLLLGMRTY